MKIKLLALAAASMIASAATAAPITLNLAWSGAEYGNTATGVGSMTIDDASINHSLQYDSAATLGITAFSVTFTSSGGSSVTYGLGDFYQFGLGLTSGSLNVHQELIGQNLGNGCNFGQRGGACGSGASGDFNLFSQSGAPNGNFYFQLPFAGESLGVTSMVEDVPEPAMIGLFGLGAIGLGLSRRRRA